MIENTLFNILCILWEIVVASQDYNHLVFLQARLCVNCILNVMWLDARSLWVLNENLKHQFLKKNHSKVWIIISMWHMIYIFMLEIAFYINCTRSSKIKNWGSLFQINFVAIIFSPYYHSCTACCMSFF